MPETILITGSTGFLGKSIIDKVNHLMIKTVGRCKSCDFVFDLKNTELSFLNFHFDTVIHIAGKAHSIPGNIFEQNDFYEVNYKGTINLLNALLGNPPKKFVFISTVAVYGENCGIQIGENSPLFASDPYGESKRLAEGVIIDWCSKNNVKFTILRLPLVIGNIPKGNLKSMVNAIKNGYYFNIAGGNARKSMVLAEDIASVILNVSEVGGIYNLTDGYHPSFAELSVCISKQLGKRKPLNVPMWAARIIARIGDLSGNKAPLNSNKLSKITSNLTFDDTKAREAFGWNPAQVLDGFKIN
ncbi:MAG: NAD-dependent epimerase/dehydratase family protein [Lutibacter sp.]|nr:NAD-dependent epimerase/dehydratase family protein [Lutibacter sp.]